MKIFFLFIINYVTSYNINIFSINTPPINTPPINTIYYKKIYIPLIGNQLIETNILTQNKVNINLIGIININGFAFYHEKNNKIDILFCNELLQFMEQLKCNCSSFSYNKEREQISFSVSIKGSYLNKKIVLNKKKYNNKY